jgi:hypothetical protein
MLPEPFSEKVGETTLESFTPTETLIRPAAAPRQPNGGHAPLAPDQSATLQTCPLFTPLGQPHATNAPSGLLSVPSGNVSSLRRPSTLVSSSKAVTSYYGTSVGAYPTSRLIEYRRIQPEVSVGARYFEFSRHGARRVQPHLPSIALEPQAYDRQTTAPNYLTPPHYHPHLSRSDHYSTYSQTTASSNQIIGTPLHAVGEGARLPNVDTSRETPESIQFHNSYGPVEIEQTCKYLVATFNDDLIDVL